MTPLKKTLCITFPRSGHHFLVNLLLSYFSESPHFPLTDGKHTNECSNPLIAGKFGYCEYYNHCTHVPCPNHAVNFMKNHDFYFDLDANIIANKIVQYRHPLKSIASIFEFDTRRLPDAIDEWSSFSEHHFLLWKRFMNRWMLTKVEGNVLYVKYEDLINNTKEHLYRVLLHLGERRPHHSMIRKAVQFQRIKPDSYKNKLSNIPEQWVRTWEERNRDLLIATNIPFLYNEYHE